jgi:hypothetical protein
MTLTHRGGVDIEGWKSQIAMVPFDPLIGLRSFVVANAVELRRRSLCGSLDARDVWHLVRSGKTGMRTACTAFLLGGCASVKTKAGWLRCEVGVTQSTQLSRIQAFCHSNNRQCIPKLRTRRSGSIGSLVSPRCAASPHLPHQHSLRVDRRW